MDIHGIFPLRHGTAGKIVVADVTAINPAVAPDGGLQVYDPAVCALILKMQENPSLSLVVKVDKRALMRSVYFRIALGKNNFRFVRTVNIRRPQRDLPARFYTARRRKYIKVFAAFIKFGTLYFGRNIVPVVKNSVLVVRAHQLLVRFENGKL